MPVASVATVALEKIQSVGCYAVAGVAVEKPIFPWSNWSGDKSPCSRFYPQNTLYLLYIFLF